MKEGYCVQMDSDVENSINVFNEDGLYIKFVCVNDSFITSTLTTAVAM